MRKLIDAILRRCGYYRCDYGFSCGRHWVRIDGRVIAQSNADEVWMPDRFVHALGYVCFDRGRRWEEPRL